MLTRNHSTLREAAKGLSDHPEAEQKPSKATIADASEAIIAPVKTNATERSRARREARYNEVKDLLRHEVASITVKTARAGLYPLFHRRFSTGMNKELPGQCNLIA